MGISTAVGIGTRNMGILGTATTNTAIEAGDSFFRQNKTLRETAETSAITFVTTTTGGYIGKKIENIANAKYNPTRNKYEFETVYVPYPIEIQRKESIVPSVLGNIADNLGSSTFEFYLNDKVKEFKGEK